MRPPAWHPPVELSSLEQTIIARIKRAKLFIFLRHHRDALFDGAFQEELATLYVPSLRGQPPIPPAQLALATIVQAYTGVSDDEVIEATLMDRRWQLVLDCLDAEQAPFSKGTLVAFRKRFIAAQMDRRLIERTIEIASQSQDFGPRALRAALDSSPLWGAGRVEDTISLIGHALKKRMGVVAEQQGRELVEAGQEAGAEMVCGSSLKTALDRDWDQSGQREEALGAVLHVLQAVETWAQTLQLPKDTCAQCPLKTQCTTSAKGRSVSIHLDEALLIELRERQQTPQGRAQLRERVAVEHTLAHVGRWQGRRARYRGQRKNLFDLRRCAVVHNLHVLARSQSLSAELQNAD